MRILILNWRDPKNPRAGGAEVFTHEIAKRLVLGGDRVEWFSASFPGAPAEEEQDGVRVLRGGRQWSVHWQAFRRYRARLRAQFDVVIDEVNTVPFFTPLWADVPAVMLIYQLARQVWWYESPFPVNVLGFAMEPAYLRFYRQTRVLTLSSSTRANLLDFGFRGPITVMPPAIESGYLPPAVKEKIPTFLYVGRLAPSKRLDHILQAFRYFKDARGTGHLWVIGEGDRHASEKIRALATELGVEKDVLLLGRVSPDEKYSRMARAHALLMASVREGWGLSVTEANACGTPAVVYDVPGLRDAVRHEETGLVVQPSPRILADGMLRLLREDGLRSRLTTAAMRWSRSLSFEASTAVFREAIDTAVRTVAGNPAQGAETHKDPAAVHGLNK